MKKKLNLLLAIVFLFCQISFTAQTCIGDVIIERCIGALEDGSMEAHYEDNLDCNWTILNPLNVPMHIVFTAFQLESCCDFLYIYDGPNEQSALLGVFSGQTIPTDFISTSESLHLRFTTNDSNNFNGWTMTWDGTKTMTACSGILADGSGNANYSNNQYTAWRISPPGATNITIHFDSFSTEVKFDNVYVYDGPNSLSPMLGAFSGSDIPQTLISTGGEILVVFNTDGSGNAAGWTASYSIPDPILTSCSGYIDNVPDGMGYSYTENEMCSWLIQPEEGNPIQFHFTHLDTEAFEDEIFIYDGATIDDPLLGSFSGEIIPIDLIANSGLALVQFVSNASDNRNGFRLEYNCNFSVIQPFDNIILPLVYPNPSNGILHLSNIAADFKPTRCIIRNVIGSPLNESDFTYYKDKNSLTIHTIPLVSGTYFIQLFSEKNSVVVKFVVE